MQIEGYVEIIKKWILNSGLKILFVIIATLIAFKLVNLLTKRLFGKPPGEPDAGEFDKRTKTLRAIIHSALDFVISIVAFMIILDIFEIQIGPILAAAGVVGLAVGFGAQKLVADIITGFFMILDDQIRIGDVVQIGDKAGLVEKINIRRIVLRDLGGDVHYIRNGSVDLVTNKTKEFSYYIFDIGVAYRENVDEVIEVIKQIDEELRQDNTFKDKILEPIEVLGLDKFADSAIIVKARVKTKPIKQWEVGREFNRRLKKKFDELGIEIPFPHLTVYAGRDKQGKSPPFEIRGHNTN